MSMLAQRSATRRKTREEMREERKPDYTVRARNGRGWSQVGAAWKPDRDGNTVISVKLNHIPVGFDGVLKVMLPLPDDEDDQSQD